MDHLLTPKHPARPTPRVRYFCQQEYDRGDFLTYPERMGWVDEGDTWLDLSAWCDADEATAFLQQWLFFGLLHEFFGDSADFSAFIETDENSGIRYVHTRELLPLARAFMEREKVDTVLSLRKFDFRACLKKTFSVYHAVTDEQEEFLDPYFQLSLVATARFLTHVAKLLYPDGFEVWNWTLPCISLDEDRLANAKVNDLDADMDILGVEMIQSGWCPRQVGIAERCSFETYYFCSQLQLGKPANLDHRTCTQTQCLALQVEKGTYHTKHVQPGCGCAWRSLETNALGDILRAGNIPIVALDDDEKLNLSFAEIDSDHPTYYVAISHVWSDGLGNPQDNAMPLCQLRRIQKLVQGLSAPQNPGAPKTWFWMDTLCCPVKDENARRVAIRRMRHTYQKSGRVLVLAADLQEVEASDLPLTDRVYLAGLSFWASRLWTLQEGALGSHVDMLFKDTIFPLDSAWNANLANEDEWGLDRVNPVDFNNTLRLIRGDKTAQASNNDPTRFSLSFAVTAVSRRTTSYREDEALCLGSLLEADMQEITQAERKDRLKALWRTLPSIPREILFLREATMEEPGYRWAPSTLLGIPDAGDRVILSSEGTAIATPEGLRTTAHCIDLDSFEYPLKRPISGILRIRDQNSGELYSLLRQAPLLNKPENFSNFFSIPDVQFIRAALLVEDPVIGRGGKYCVMVFVYKEEGGVRYARRGDPAFIIARDINIDWEDDGSGSGEAKNSLEEIWGSEICYEAAGLLQERPYAWCVD